MELGVIWLPSSMVDPGGLKGFFQKCQRSGFALDLQFAVCKLLFHSIEYSYFTEHAPKFS